MIKLSEKEIIILAIVVVIVAILLLLITSCNTKKSKKIKGRFYESEYKKDSKEYYEAESVALTFYVDNVLRDGKKDFETGKLYANDIIQLLYILPPDASNKVCYKKEFLQEKASEYFNYNYLNLASDEQYYYESDYKICFKRKNLRDIEDPKVVKSEVYSDSVEVIVDYNQNRYQYFYTKQGDKTYLYNVLKE